MRMKHKKHMRAHKEHIEHMENHMYHIVIFPVVLVYFEIMLRIFNKTGIFSHLIYPVLFGLGTGMLLSYATSVYSKKVNRILTLIILTGIALLFTIECLVYSSMQFYLPLDAMGAMAGDVAADYLDQVVQTIITSIPVIFFYFLPSALYWKLGKEYIPAEYKKPKVTFAVLGAAVLCITLGVWTAGSGKLADHFKGQYKFDAATLNFGLISSLELDVVYDVFGNDAADLLVINADGTEEAEEEDEAEIEYEKNIMDLPLDEISAATTDETLISMNEYVKSLPASSQNEYTGLFKGKNLILICAEAFSHAAVDKELTPTLYRMVHNGFYFSDYYQPSWNGSTSTGEYSTLMGIAPLKDVRTMPDTIGKNLYFTLGNQLHREGYTGNAYHNGSYKYYSRNETHLNFGYDEWIAQDSGLEDLAKPWCHDVEMFEGTLPTYIDKQPFSVYYMTVSGHFPYKEDHEKTRRNIEYVREICGDKYKDKTLYYLCYQMELEKSVTYLIETLEEAGIADDTVICINADHYPYGLEKGKNYGNDEDYIEDLYGYYPENSWERNKNALIIWSGCLENEQKDMACEISEPTFSLDIVPTLSNLFGLEYDSRLLAGRDVFSDAEPLVFWINNSWVTTEGKYDSETGTFYPNEGSEADDEYVERIKTEVANKLSFSGKILSYDYYDILLGDGLSEESEE